jgi:crotonobetainyl-CoA:carnitine CoA-transferase CaiB-like acyl-CoA transferase
MIRTIAGVSLVGSPVRLDGTRADSDVPPPSLGEHTDEILAGIGIDDREIGALEEGSVIGR